MLDATALPVQEAPSEEASAYALRLGQMEQIIINGEARIGRLMILMVIMGELRQSTEQAEALIGLYQGHLHRWNDNRLRMISRYEAPPATST